MTTRIIFNTLPKLKTEVQKRAEAEGTDLTSVLNRFMSLYAEGSFDPDDYMTKEDITMVRRGLAEVRTGKVLSEKQTRAHFKKIDAA